MNTVSRTKTLMITALMPLVAAPTLSHAEAVSRADASLNACVKAFVSTKFAKERRYEVVTTNASDFDPHASSYRISLAATGKQTGKKLARATCTVDRTGVYLSTNGKTYALPSTGESTVLSAR